MSIYASYVTKDAFFLLFSFCSYSLAFFGGSDNYVDKFKFHWLQRNSNEILQHGNVELNVCQR